MPLRSKDCHGCGRSFTPDANRQVYCHQPECPGAYGRATCEECGVIFEVVPNTTGRHCSRRCFNASRAGDNRRRPCVVCGADFKPRNQAQQSCSRACGAMLTAEKTRKERLVRTCGVCGESFDATHHPLQQVCSLACRGRLRAMPREPCERCGGPVDSRYRLQRFCSNECRRQPLGTRRPTTEGYMQVKTERGWLMEHRVVMERIVGRPLRPEERVHHRNGQRDDNAESNLELWVILPHSTKDPAGQRVADLIAFMVERYPEQVRAAVA